MNASLLVIPRARGLVSSADGSIALVRRSQAWTPRRLGNALIAWYRSDRGVSVDASGLVTQWTDLSRSEDPNKDLFPAATLPLFQPSNPAYRGRPTVYFGPGALLSSGLWLEPLALPETVFVVGNDNGAITPGTAYQYYTDTTYQVVGTGGRRELYYAPAPAGTYAISSGLAGFSTPRPATTAAGAPVIFAAYFTTVAGGNQIYLSRLTPRASGSIGAATDRLGISLGNSNRGAEYSLKGSIAEALVVRGALSTDDFALTMNYLSTRYEIALG